MALLIEDGTLTTPGANSWVTVAEWETYLALYGKAATGTETDKETALIKAQRAISTRYTLDGTYVEQNQPTCLPRLWSRKIKGYWIASDAIPTDFKDSQSEMAWSIQEGSDPFADKTQGTLGPLTGDSAKAGPVETSKTYGSGGTPFDPLSMSNYTAANALLKPYLAAGAASGQVRIQRG